MEPVADGEALPDPALCAVNVSSSVSEFSYGGVPAVVSPDFVEDPNVLLETLQGPNVCLDGSRGGDFCPIPLCGVIRTPFVLPRRSKHMSRLHYMDVDSSSSDECSSSDLVDLPPAGAALKIAKGVPSLSDIPRAPFLPTRDTLCAVQSCPECASLDDVCELCDENEAMQYVSGLTGAAAPASLMAAIPEWSSYTPSDKLDVLDYAMARVENKSADGLLAEIQDRFLETRRPSAGLTRLIFCVDSGASEHICNDQ